MIERRGDPDASPSPTLHAPPPPLPHPQGSQGWWWLKSPCPPLNSGSLVQIFGLTKMGLFAVTVLFGLFYANGTNNPIIKD